MQNILRDVVEFESDDDKARYLILKLHKHRVGYYYAKRLFKTILKNEKWKTGVTLNPTSFVSNKVQERFPSSQSMQKMFDYCIEHKVDDPKVHPILFVFYTGLRSVEVRNVTNKVILQCLLGESPVSLVRKGGKLWEPTFTENFVEYCNFVSEWYHCTDMPPEAVIWNYSAGAMLLRMKNLYLKAVGAIPPVGLGIHSIRYFLATDTLLTEGKNVAYIQHLLGHSKLTTTQIYTRLDQNVLDNTQVYSL